ncbi:hypothetical protein ACM66B_004118 [Microbotryomycetes sp. NB124-2]
MSCTRLIKTNAICRSTRTLMPSSSLRSASVAAATTIKFRSFASSSRTLAGQGEGIGEKKPAASHEGQGPVSKRIHYAKNMAFEAAETLQRAVGKRPEVVKGDGTSGKVDKIGVFIPDDIPNEERIKGKAAGGTKRNH